MRGKADIFAPYLHKNDFKFRRRSIQYEQFNSSKIIMSNKECQHRYKLDQGQQKKCPYSDLYKKWQKENNDDTIFLPINPKDKKCIFHTTDQDFKIKNNFLTKFNFLVQLLNKEDDLLDGLMDFSEFIFVKGQNKQSTYIENMIFSKEVDFKGSRFANFTVFKNVHFNTDVFFEGVRFLDDIHFVNCVFEEADFSLSEFFAHVEFQKCIFGTEKFDTKIEFSDILVKSTFSFIGAEIKHQCRIIFDNSSLFNAIETKVFSDSVRFQDFSKANGQIEFNYVNLYLINRDDYKNLLSLQEEKKVIIGPGCEEYRLRKKITIDRNPYTENLIREIANTFVAYCQLVAIIQVRVDFKYKTKTIEIVYYSDENIKEEEWIEKLNYHTPHFTEILQNPNICKSPNFIAKINEIYQLDRALTYSNMNNLDFQKFDLWASAQGNWLKLVIREALKEELPSVLEDVLKAIPELSENNKQKIVKQINITFGAWKSNFFQAGNDVKILS